MNGTEGRLFYRRSTHCGVRDSNGSAFRHSSCQFALPFLLIRARGQQRFQRRVERPCNLDYTHCRTSSQSQVGRTNRSAVREPVVSSGWLPLYRSRCGNGVASLLDPAYDSDANPPHNVRDGAAGLGIVVDCNETLWRPSQRRVIWRSELVSREQRRVVSCRFVWFLRPFQRDLGARRVGVASEYGTTRRTSQYVAMIAFHDLRREKQVRSDREK